MAHATCLAAARHVLLARRGQGGDRPTIVVLNAGDAAIGAFDPFETLIPVARAHGAWVHVDGALGLWVATAPAHKDLARGVDHADSWAVDGHKWLNVPYDCGDAFVADASAHRITLSHQPSWLLREGQARDAIDWTPEWSRRARGFATYAALRQLGRRGVEDLIERTCRHAANLVRGIGALAHATVVWSSRLNQGLVRFLDRRTDASPADHDRMTDAVIAQVLEEGDCFFTGATWRGMRVMRITVCNWQTSDDDVRRAAEAVQRAILRCQAEPSLTRRPSVRGPA